jgi:ABC-type transport system involved in multi-copper enzyme maturation permease subunit
MAVETELLVERTPRFEGMKISWGGVFGGVLAGVGALMLLSSLGLAIGISATNPGDPDGSALGIGAAVWAGLSLLVALFIAGWASTRLSMLWERTTAMFEGVLVWVLSLILILYLTANGIGLVASGAAGLLGKTAQAVGTSVASMDVEALSSGDVDAILGRLRDPQTATIVAGATGTSREQAQNTLRDISQRVEGARNDPAAASAEARRGIESLAAQARQNLQQTATAMKPEATATAWLTFAALVLSLLAAISGAAVGRRGVVGRVERGELGQRRPHVR